jgi:Arc/MetJ-type ribon-helix-helix transcriptional regulator
MKHKLSISVNEETIIKIRDAMRDGKFRNKSHAFEFAVNEVLKNDIRT